MDSTRESLSALVDGELGSPGAAIDGMLSGDPDARAQWSRYHLIGEILRGGDAKASISGLDERIRMALAHEPHLLVPRVPFHGPHRAPRLAPALAASIAALGIFGVLLVSNAPEREALQEFAHIDNAGSAVADWRQQPVQATTADTAELRRRLNSYIVNFNEQRDNLAVPNVHPYVRIVGFEKEPLR